MNVFNIKRPAVFNCLMIIVSCILCHPVTKDGATLQITVDGDAGAEVVGVSGATAANTNDPLYFGGLPGKKMPSLSINIMAGILERLLTYSCD